MLCKGLACEKVRDNMIREICLNNWEEWDSIVKSFHDYDVYYLSGYVKAFRLNGDGEPVLLYFEGDGVRAINVVMKRDIGLFEKLSSVLEQGKYYDIVTPYGYGGFLLEGSYTDRMHDEYVQYCEDNHIVCEFVRFHPLLKNHQNVEGLYHQTRLGSTVTMYTETPEIIWQNLTSKNRNMVRKAQKSGLQVYWARDIDLIDDFMEVYNATMDKDNAETYYYFQKEFYESILMDLKQHALWFYAKKDSEIASIAIFLFANGRMHYHLSASRKEYQSLAPTNLLLYEAAVWASHNGYRFLHLGGGLGSGNDSLYSFKKAFNRKSDTCFYIGKRIFDNEMYEYFVNERKKDKSFEQESHYFPLYRA